MAFFNKNKPDAYFLVCQSYCNCVCRYHKEDLNEKSLNSLNIV